MRTRDRVFIYLFKKTKTLLPHFGRNFNTEMNLIEPNWKIRDLMQQDAGAINILKYDIKILHKLNCICVDIEYVCFYYLIK